MPSRRFPPPWSVEEGETTKKERRRCVALALLATGTMVALVWVVRVLSVPCGKVIDPARSGRSPYPKEDDAMLENDVNGRAELDEDILTFDVPDDALERAAPIADRRIITLYCTKDPLSCGWPL
jgi:hypothetical protein